MNEAGSLTKVARFFYVQPTVEGGFSLLPGAGFFRFFNASMQAGKDLGKGSGAMTKKEKSSENQAQPEAERKARSVLELSASEARSFFLKSESYCKMDLPAYFVFDDLLRFISERIGDRNPDDFYDRSEFKSLSLSSDEINHAIFSNKDGKYAWQRLQLINPFLYVSLVREITEENHWEAIKKRFEYLSRNRRIECASYPVESLTGQKDKAEQISSWRENLEQQSLSLALDYEYLIHTDISDCYGSMYTHSIAWALHGKDEARREREDKKRMTGNMIDGRIQDIRGGQTNGIPQGSVLMDFIAEMVLGYVDSRLSERIEDEKIEDYRILRYRDDYRIFTNNPKDGEAILKLLMEELADPGLKLNSSKTLVTGEVIRESIKPDKLFWIGQGRREKDPQKQLLIIHDLAVRFPDSGSLVTALNDYYRMIIDTDDKIAEMIKKDLHQLISIITDIAYRNRKVYNISCAILSKFVCLIDDDEQKKEMIEKIERRLARIPNIGHLEIWLQRITVNFDRGRSYEEKLCRLVEQGASGTGDIWDLSWLNGRLGEEIGRIGIVDEKRIEELPSSVEGDEVELFRSEYY